MPLLSMSHGSKLRIFSTAERPPSLPMPPSSLRYGRTTTAKTQVNKDEEDEADAVFLSSTSCAAEVLITQGRKAYVTPDREAKASW